MCLVSVEFECEITAKVFKMEKNNEKKYKKLKNMDSRALRNLLIGTFTGYRGCITLRDQEKMT